MERGRLTAVVFLGLSLATAYPSRLQGAAGPSE